MSKQCKIFVRFLLQKQPRIHFPNFAEVSGPQSKNPLGLVENLQGKCPKELEVSGILIVNV